MSRSVRLLLGVLLVVVLLIAGAAGLIWWKLNGLKAHLLAGLGKSLGADVQVASLDIDPWKSELHAAGITPHQPTGVSALGKRRHRAGDHPLPSS